MTNSLDPDQTDPGPHCLFLHLNLSVILGNYIYIYLQQTTSADAIFSDAFFFLAL